jgi:hypothetical protein
VSGAGCSPLRSIEASNPSGSGTNTGYRERHVQTTRLSARFQKWLYWAWGSWGSSLSFIDILQSDATVEALLLRCCLGNRTLFDYYCEQANIEKPDPLLTRWERLAVWKYSNLNSYWYREVNEGLRSGAPSDDIKAVSHLLTVALQKLPRHTGIAYRGIRVADLGSFCAAATSMENRSYGLPSVVQALRHPRP